MKVYKKILIPVIVISLISMGVFAEGNLKNIEVSQNSVVININGTKLESDNFVYNGVTYVPLRVISENLNQEVIYDADTKTVNIQAVKNPKIQEKIQPQTENETKQEIKESKQKTEKEKNQKDKIPLTYATPIDDEHTVLVSSPTPVINEADLSNKSEKNNFLVNIDDLKLELQAYEAYSYSYGIYGNLTNNSKYSLLYYKITVKDKITGSYMNAYQRFEKPLKPNKTAKIFTCGDHTFRKDRTVVEFLNDLELYQVKYTAIDDVGNKIKILYNAETETYEEIK